MKYLSEFRDELVAKRLLAEIERIVSGKWAIMEICGGQTHSIIRNEIDQLLPSRIEMIHGPGCPVCVTPLEILDKALVIAARPEVIFYSFGDMLRVPGTTKDLFQVRSEGGDVRVVYSPLDALKIARQTPDRQVVFFGIGFETTAPANAMALFQARQQELGNFSMLISHFLVPPAIEAILSSPANRVQGFLAAGHVCSVMGYWQYLALAEKYHVPIVVTGFEPLDILEGIRRVVQQLETGRAEVENAYSRVVSYEGNLPAQKLVAEVFEVTDRSWRGIGLIAGSGWKLRASYQGFDANERFKVQAIHSCEPAICHSGAVLQGLVQNKLQKLIERPAMQGVTLPPPNRNPLPNTTQIFECYPFTLCLCGLHHAFANLMIGMPGKTRFFATTLFKKAFSRFSSLSLQFSPEFYISSPDVINCFTAKLLALASGSKLDYSQIYPDKISRYIRGRLNYIYGNEQIPLTITINQVTLTLAQFQEFALLFATHEGDSLATFDSLDRNFSGVVPQDTIFISNRAVFSENPLPIFIKLVSITNFSYQADNHLGGKFGIFFKVMVNQMVQLKLPKSAGMPSRLTNLISRLISLFKSSEQVLGLLLSGFKL